MTVTGADMEQTPEVEWSLYCCAAVLQACADTLLGYFGRPVGQLAMACDAFVQCLDPAADHICQHNHCNVAFRVWQAPVAARKEIRWRRVQTQHERRQC